jgi:uncharacterized membrane protein HdeD (DUF308 family)
VLRFTELVRGTSPVVATVAAVLLIIVGLLVIVYPGLLAWLAGIGLVLGGVATLVSAFGPSDRFGP